jgi:hypothetical protein
MTRSISTRALVIAVLFVGAAGVGCSISNSSGSISDSSGSMSDSSGSSANSSKSSSDGDTAYRGDIETHTIAALEAREFDAIGAASFTRELGAIAEAHSITDWDASAHTFFALGRGLHRAGLTREQALDFHRRVFGPDEDREFVLLRGFGDAGRVS